MKSIEASLKVFNDNDNDNDYLTARSNKEGFGGWGGLGGFIMIWNSLQLIFPSPSASAKSNIISISSAETWQSEIKNYFVQNNKYSVCYHLDRKVDHDMVEILPCEEVIVHLVLLGSVQLGEGLRPAENLWFSY